MNDTHALFYINIALKSVQCYVIVGRMGVSIFIGMYKY
jgi:hypothetical protein